MKRYVVPAVIIAAALVLFWSFAGSAMLYRAQHPIGSGIFADLHESPFDLDPVHEVLPGVVVPLLLAAFALWRVTSGPPSRD